MATSGTSWALSAPNNWVQATPVYAFLFFLSQRPGAPEKV